jgi:hypothetical protein
MRITENNSTKMLQSKDGWYKDGPSHAAGHEDLKITHGRRLSQGRSEMERFGWPQFSSY